MTSGASVRSGRPVREFARGIESGTSPAPNFDDGLHRQESIDAARESDRAGRRFGSNITDPEFGLGPSRQRRMQTAKSA